MKFRVLSKLAIACLSITMLYGCNSEIEKVKNGTLSGHEQTTIGKAIESVFGEVEWNYFETDKGVRVVEAKGWPSLQMFTKSFVYSFQADKAIEQYCVSPQKMVIQFTLLANSDSFEASFCGSEKGKPSNCNSLFNYIYLNDSKYEPMTEKCQELMAEKAKKEAEKEAEKARAEEEKRLAEEKRKDLEIEAMASIKFFTDLRDNRAYRTVKIGTQRWMAQNLNFASPSSVCYGDDSKKCEDYGRLYTWHEAIKVCPDGWRLPSKNDFDTLKDVVKDLDALRSLNDYWNTHGGSDAFAFTMLPAGEKRHDTGNFVGLRTYAYFWSSTENDIGGAIGYENMIHDNFFKNHFFSVRCLMDDPHVEELLVEPEYDLE